MGEKDDFHLEKKEIVLYPESFLCGFYRKGLC